MEKVKWRSALEETLTKAAKEVPDVGAKVRLGEFRKI